MAVSVSLASYSAQLPMTSPEAGSILRQMRAPQVSDFDRKANLCCGIDNVRMRTVNLKGLAGLRGAPFAIDVADALLQQAWITELSK
jgi:hypothetical protein